MAEHPVLDVNVLLDDWNIDLIEAGMDDRVLPPLDLRAAFPTRRQAKAKARVSAKYFEKKVSRLKADSPSRPSSGP